MKVEIWKAGSIATGSIAAPKKIAEVDAHNEIVAIRCFAEHTVGKENVDSALAVYNRQSFTINGEQYFTDERLADEHWRDAVAMGVRSKVFDVFVTVHPRAPLELRTEQF